MKLLFTLYIFFATYALSAQNPFIHDVIRIMVANNKQQPLDATIEVIGHPGIKFKLLRKEYVFTTYILEKADYPTQQDTTYYVKISSPGYNSETLLLAWGSMQICLFKPGETYAYESYCKEPVHYNNKYLACIIQNSDTTKLLKFCTDYNLKVAYRYNYCGPGFKSMKEATGLKPNTFIIARNDGRDFKQDDSIISAFRKAVPNNAGTFYSRYMPANKNDMPTGTILIYYKNEVTFTIPNKTVHNKLVKYLKTQPTVTYQYYNNNSLGPIIASLPDSWNIDKVNAFINGAMATGIAGAQAGGVTALECPTN